jgi:hypothetical protein
LNVEQNPRLLSFRLHNFARQELKNALNDIHFHLGNILMRIKDKRSGWLMSKTNSEDSLLSLMHGERHNQPSRLAVEHSVGIHRV